MAKVQFLDQTESTLQKQIADGFCFQNEYFKINSFEINKRLCSILQWICTFYGFDRSWFLSRFYIEFRLNF